MKRIILFFITYCLFTPLVKAQDTNWYIRAGSSTNNSPSQNGNLSNEFIITEFPPPNVECDSRARDDIFIILNDGQHINHRNEGQLPIRDRALYVDLPSAPLFLYATNPYDTDPPPLMVSNSEDIQDQDWSPDYTTPDSVLSANQDVVPGSDITLIIMLKKAGDISINADTVLINGSDPVEVQGALKLSPFVGETSVLNASNSSINTSNQKIEFSTDKAPYVYVNFRATERLNDYISTRFGEHKLQFSVTINGETFKHQEVINGVHDPNYYIPVSQCYCDEDTTLTYFCTFENENPSPAKNLQVKIPLESSVNIDVSDIIVDSLNILGKSVSKDSIDVSVNKDKDSLIFSFKQGIRLMPCGNNQRGLVSFLFSLPKGSLSQVTGLTFMSGIPFDLRYSPYYCYDNGKLYKDCQVPSTPCAICPIPPIRWWIWLILGVVLLLLALAASKSFPK